MDLLHRTRDDERTDDTVILDRANPDETRTREVETEDKVKVRERTWTFAPGQLVSLVVGVGAVAIGLVTMLRAGIDNSFAAPVVEVLRFTHTAWLGLAEVGLGLLLIVAGAGPRGRPLSVLLGAGMVVAGVLVTAVPDELPDELGLERDFGWALIMFGALVALASLILPVWRSHRVTRNGVAVEPERSERTVVSAH